MSTNKLKILDKYILRKPYLPLSFFDKLLESKNIIEFLDDGFIKESIFLSSKSTYKFLYSANKKLEEKQYLTLFKYLIRFSTRATPLLSVSNLSVQNYNQLIYKKGKLKRRTRISDFDIFKLIENHIFKNNDYFELDFFVNPTAFKINNYYYFQKISNNSKPTYISNEKIKSNEVLDFIFEQANNPIKLKILIKSLHNYFKDKYQNIENEIYNFIDNLIKLKFLKSELEPHTTNGNYLNFLINNQSLNKHYKPTIDILNSLNNQLNYLDLSFTNSVDNYLNINKYISSENSYHIDSFDTTKIISCKLETKNINTVIHFILKYSKHPKNQYLNDFKKEFKFKYGNKRVKLIEIFNEEYGLSFDKKQYYNFDFFELDLKPTKLNDGYKNKAQFNFFNKIINNQNHINLENFLNAQDYSNLKEEFYIVYEEYYNENFKFHLKFGNINNQQSLINRFCHQKEFKKLGEQLINTSKNFIEINILEDLHKSNLYNKNIVPNYNLDFNHKKESDIDINNLLITIKKGNILLIDEQNIEYTPILSSALNYKNSKSRTFRFLVELQYQKEKKHIHFEWDYRFYNYNSLPRLSYKDIIIKKRCWILRFSKIQTLKELHQWKRVHNIPNRVSIVENDNELPLDLKSDYSCIIIFQFLKKNKLLILYEYLFNTENGLNINKKKYSNEKISFFKNE